MVDGLFLALRQMTMPAPSQLKPGLWPAAIPDELKAQPRWAPWKAKWNERRGKWDKIPCSIAPPHYGLSTHRLESWGGFDDAVAAARAAPDKLAGIGYNMTGEHGVVGVDLDHCIVGGVIAPWAKALVDRGHTYTEISPSGAGLRMFFFGTCRDWTNHDVGIEVYAGCEARFLTVTGARLAGTPAAVRQAPAGLLDDLASEYARERSAPPSSPPEEMPELLDEVLLPELDSLELPYAVRDFLIDGTTRGDRSRELYYSAVALMAATQDAQVVLSLLVASPHAMEVALDHRRQDYDRALAYIWKEHALKAKARGLSRVANDDDFESLPDAGEGTQPPGSVSAPEAGADPLPKTMFDIQPAWRFVQSSKTISWLLKGLLPHAELGAVFGASGAGKSFFVIDMAIAVARGRDWRGHRCKQAGVLYVAAEGAMGVVGRLKAHAQYHGHDLKDLPLTVLGAAPNILERGDVKGLIESIKRRCGENTRLIIMDTLAQVTPGANENSAEDMGRAVAHCQAIARATSAMVLLVAHAGKDVDRGLRGWSGIKAALDLEIVVERSGDYRAAVITKLKDGTTEGAKHPFSLVTVELGIDADGDPITSAVLPAVIEKTCALPPKHPVQQLILTVLEGFIDPPTQDELLASVVPQMEQDEGKRDTRRQRAKESLAALVASGTHVIKSGEFYKRA